MENAAQYTPTTLWLLKDRIFARFEGIRLGATGGLLCHSPGSILWTKTDEHCQQPPGWPQTVTLLFFSV